MTRGLKEVVIPRQNMRDLADVPKDLLSRLTVHPADTLDDVLEVAFDKATKKKLLTKATSKKIAVRKTASP